MLNSTIANLDAILTKKSIDISLCAFVLIEFIAIAANIIFIKEIFQKQRTHNRTHIYMIFVSSANLGVAFFVIPFTIVTLVARKWIFGAIFCYISGFMVIFWFSFTIYTMTILSLHNYCAIVHPMFRPHGTKIAFQLLAAALVISLAIAISAIGYDGVTFDTDIAQCTPIKKTREKMFSAVMIFTLCFVLPTCMNLFAYWKAIRALSVHSAWLKSNAINYETTIKSEKHVTKTLYGTFTLYMFCWTPFFLLFIVYVSAENVSQYHTLETLRLAAFTTGNLSSALNPLIYLVRNKLHSRLYSHISKRLSTILRHGARCEKCDEAAIDISLVTETDGQRVDEDGQNKDGKVHKECDSNKRNCAIARQMPNKDHVK